MMGDIDWFGQIFGAVPEGMIAEFNKNVARAMIRAGLAVVLIEPNSKVPLCTLSARDRAHANKIAQDAARERGSVNWARVKHDCGLHHALTEEKQLNHAMVKRHLEDGCNLAISFAHSKRRVLVIDLDTEDERRAFIDTWAEHAGPDGAPDLPLTVTSPGVYDEAADVWKHKNGGHLWMDVPDGAALPERPGKASWCVCHQFNTAIVGDDGKRRTCPHAWAAYWGSSYVLVPPSVRKEGVYRVTGSVVETPAWLLELLAGAERAPAADGGDGLNFDSADSINTWTSGTSWAAILTADGFTETGQADNCGCPTWMRPGGTHEKSATAHEDGCAKYTVTDGNGPIHFWSDALRIDGRETVSKLTYLAHTRYGGDVRAAMDALGIARGTGGGELDDLGPIPDRVPAGKADAPQAGANGKEGSGGVPPPASSRDVPLAPDGDDVKEFWGARPVLCNIHDHAWSKIAAPWATLGAVLAYVTALTPPRVTVNDGSLNLFAGLVGPPGAGKNAAIKAARSWVGRAADGLYERGIGSGQGIEAGLVNRVRDPENESRWINRQIRENILIQAGEIDQLTAHSRQQASTTIATLRQVWQAEALGGMYKDASKDIAVAADSYRASMIVGIQPGRAMALIQDASGGLPQRFLWMPTTDTSFPPNPRDYAPEPWEWKPPVPCRDLSVDPFTIDGADDGGNTEPDLEMGLCPKALAELDANRIARIKGIWDGDEFATHDGLGKLKVAAALALLEGRTDVTEEDWDLAGVVIRVSQHVRSMVIYGLEEEDRKRREAERKEIVETHREIEKAKDATAVENAARRILVAIVKGGSDWQAKNTILRSISKSARNHWQDAVNLLVAQSRIEVRDIEEPGRKGVQVRSLSGSGE